MELRVENASQRRGFIVFSVSATCWHAGSVSLLTDTSNRIFLFDVSIFLPLFDCDNRELKGEKRGEKQQMSPTGLAQEMTPYRPPGHSYNIFSMGLVSLVWMQKLENISDSSDTAVKFYLK